MGKKDPRIDEYIANAADFAQPILRHIRQLVHAADPEVQETLKWRMPHFVHHGIVCNMAAFKAHCSFGFWKQALLFQGKPPPGRAEGGMGQFGRITKVSDLPSDKVLIGYIKKAVRLNDTSAKLSAKPKAKEKKELIVPEYFRSALGQDKKALTAFEGFSYSHKKEYVEWITEAKTEETRQKRMHTAIAWLAEGKPRNWKYSNC